MGYVSYCLIQNVIWKLFGLSAAKAGKALGQQEAYKTWCRDPRKENHYTPAATTRKGLPAKIYEAIFEPNIPQETDEKAKALVKHAKTWLSELDDNDCFPPRLERYREVLESGKVDEETYREFVMALISEAFENDSVLSDYEAKEFRSKAVDLDLTRGKVQQILFGMVNHVTLARIAAQRLEWGLRDENTPRTEDTFYEVKRRFLAALERIEDDALYIYERAVVQASGIIRESMAGKYVLPHESHHKTPAAYIKLLMEKSDSLFERISGWLTNDQDTIIMELHHAREGNQQESRDALVMFLIMLYSIITNIGSVSDNSSAGMGYISHAEVVMPQLMRWMKKPNGDRSEAYINGLADLENEAKGVEGWKGIKNEDTARTSHVFWLIWVLFEQARAEGFSLMPEDVIIGEITTQHISNRYKKYLLGELNRMPRTMLPKNLPAKSSPGNTLQRLYVHHHFSVNAPESYNGERSFNTIFDAFPKDEKQPVRLMVCGKDGWGKTTALSATTCCFALERSERSWIAGDSAGAMREFRPVYVRIKDIATVWEGNGSDACKNFVRYMYWATRPFFDQACNNDSDTADGMWDEFRRFYFVGEDSAAAKGNLLLIVDGIEEFTGVPGASLSRISLRQQFMQTLLAYLERYPNVSCIISGHPFILNDPEEYNDPNSFLSRLRDNGFLSLSVLPFARQQIESYCRKWHRLIEPDNRDPLHEQRFAEHFSLSYSLRRISKRPLYLNYAVMDYTMSMNLDAPELFESSYTVMERMARNIMLWSRNKRRPGDCNEKLHDLRDILMPISYVAFRMMDECTPHIGIERFMVLMADARRELEGKISSDSLFIREGVNAFVEEILRRTNLVNFGRMGAEKLREFSFASRPLLWYFAAYALANGVVDSEDEYSSTPYGITYIKDNMDMRCENPMYAGYVDDWIGMVSYTAVGLNTGCGPLIDYICDCTRSPAVSSRRRRHACTQILAKLITLRPVVGRSRREYIYRSAYMKYFEVTQIGKLWRIINSPSGVDFLDYAAKEFNRTSMREYPRFCWVIGYLDWINLSLVAEGEEARRPAIGLNRLESVSEWLPGATSAKEMIPELLSYIEKRLNWLDNGEDQPDDRLVRTVLILSTFFWMRSQHTLQYRRNRLDDEPAVEDQIELDDELLERCSNLLHRLIRVDGGCISSVACYTLANARRMIGKRSEAVSDELLMDIIMADYRSRKRHLADRDNDRLHHYEHDRLTHPLCGALRLLSSMHIEYPVRSTLGSDREDYSELQDFYRERWDYYYSSQEEKPLEDCELRNSMLLFRICELLDVFSIREVCEIADTMKAHRAKGPIGLPQDNEEELVGSILELARKLSE